MTATRRVRRMVLFSKPRGLVIRRVLAGVFAIAAIGLSASTYALAEYAHLTAKAVELTNVVRGATGGLVSVIVEFRTPSVWGATLEGANVDDATITSAVHAMQDTILRDTFGTADAQRIAASAPGRHVDRMDISPMFAFRGSLADVEALAAHPDVLRIHVNRLNRINLVQSVPFTGATNPMALPYVGTNQIVAVVDSGVMKTHLFLAGKVISEACYSNEGIAGPASTCPGGVGSSTAIDSGLNCNFAKFGEDCEHGTHVAGIVAGNWTGAPTAGIPSRGMAPGAKLISIAVGSRDPFVSEPHLVIYDSDILHALERVYALRNSFLPQRIASINLSIGGGSFLTGCLVDPQRRIIARLRAARIATVIAAGNAANPLAVGAPGCVPEAITVAATNDKLPVAIASYSNRGPLVDLFAPGGEFGDGQGIVSSVPMSIAFFDEWVGTSMATPHVAGAFALMREAFPNATVKQIEAALEGRGTNVTDPLTGIVRPRLRIDLALPAVTARMLLTPNDSPVVFSGPQGVGPFTAPAKRTRLLLSSNLQARYRVTGRPSWMTLTPPIGVAGQQLTFGVEAGNARTRGYGVFDRAISIANRSAAQTSQAIYTTLLTLAPADRNNNFVQALTMTATRVPGQNLGATTEAGEPTQQLMDGALTDFGSTVWWKVAFSTSGVKTINTLGSDFDTTLCAYDGNSVAALGHPLACNDFYLSQDYSPSQVTFLAEAGTTYYLQVGGWQGDVLPAQTGTYRLNLVP